MCVAVFQHVSANTRSYFFRLGMGLEVGVGAAGCRTWLHLCIPQQLHSIQPQQTGSTHHQHTTDTKSAGEINSSQPSDLGQFLLLLPVLVNTLQLGNTYLRNSGRRSCCETKASVFWHKRLQQYSWNGLHLAQV